MVSYIFSVNTAAYFVYFGGKYGCMDGKMEV